MLAIPTVIESGGARGQLFVEASAAGIPAVIIELPGGGQGGVIDLNAAEESYQALINLLRQLGMVAGEAVKPNPTFYGKLQPILAKDVGPFMPQIKPGATFEEGAVLGLSLIHISIANVRFPGMQRITMENAQTGDATLATKAKGEAILALCTEKIIEPVSYTHLDVYKRQD